MQGGDIRPVFCIQNTWIFLAMMLIVDCAYNYLYVFGVPVLLGRGVKEIGKLDEIYLGRYRV